MRAPVARAGADLRLLRAVVFAAVCVTLSATGHVLAAGQGLPAWALAAGFAAVLAVAVPSAGRERGLPGITALLTLGQTGLHLLFSTAQTSPPTGGSASGGGDRDGVIALAARLLCGGGSATGLTEAEARRVVAEAGLSGTAPGSATEAAARSTAFHGGHGLTAPAPGPEAAGTAAECLQAAVRTALSLLSGPMVLGHLLAAFAVGWMLRRGDAALWRLVRLSGHLTDELADVLLVRALRAALRWARVLCRGMSPDGAVPPRVPRGGGAEDAVPPAPPLLAHSVVRRGPPVSRHDLALAA
ncbi:hypothetical protein F0L17_13345 [Streptomyces sp. TRM43335]|uniref:Integral membrane protein n=1 Tax=Streptomyces taklimakanensis TaxID=2569853 RepID=A0A6G2BD80_9ACTN|nr:hypothetical protein [Streptomyces taklimakanensis]MTE20086.1 hypothetical protein [Streptomyces taklimakanensis]